jgi:hypothetical protein
MRVNSTSRGFLNNRFIGRSGVAFVLLAIFFITSSFTKDSSRDLRAKHANLMIRLIGHRLLLQSGDSTSRVLPVTEIREGTFLLQFENQLVLNHDSLMTLAKDLLPKSDFPSGYIVTVHDCMKGSIVYGFQMSNTSPDILACSGRSEPPGCYTIEIIFPDFYKDVERKEAGINEGTKELKSFKLNALEANPKSDELERTTVHDDIQELTGELKTPKVEAKKVDPQSANFETRTSRFSVVNLIYAGVAIVLGVISLIMFRVGKNRATARAQNQNDTIIEGPVAELTPLGKFLFDVKAQRLLFGNEVISLTEKECKILELLSQNFGELILRETLMDKVWISEGVITGRSLDMFVSKLRKKISADAELKITNVHGKGYKLEIPGTPNL